MFSMSLQSRAAALALSVAAAISAPTSAQAAGATQFVYSPVGCRTIGGSLWIYPSGQISNRSTTEVMRVFCPLIHEAKAEHTDDIHVSVVQANKTHFELVGEKKRVLRVRCRAYYNHPHASEWVMKQNEAYDAAGSEQTSLGVLETGFTVPGHKYLDGSLMLACEIPPRDTVDRSPNQGLFKGESRIGTIKSGVD